MAGGAARPRPQSSIFTGSFSEVPWAAGGLEIHTALSSPRITFSHWLRLFLGKRCSDRGCLKTDLWTLEPRAGPWSGGAFWEARRLGRGEHGEAGGKDAGEDAPRLVWEPGGLVKPIRGIVTAHLGFVLFYIS